MFFQSINLYSILVAGLTATAIVFMRVKVPYIMTKDEEESLNTFIHLTKIM